MNPSPRRPMIIAAVAASVSLAVTLLIAMKVFTTAPKAEDAPALRGGSSGPDTGSDPPVLIKLPEFELTERSGKPAGSRELRGKVWIADFVFTTCGGPCPLMSTQLAALQTRLASSPSWNDTRLVSISVDPDRDTPEALTDYANGFHADATHWLFLTGKRAEIWSLLTNGFKVPVGDKPDDSQMPILHSEKFLLIDRTGRIRGYYDGLKEEGREKLLADLAKVLKEPMSDAAPSTQPAMSEANR